MLDFLKNTQTLIASLISSILVLFLVYPNITRIQAVHAISNNNKVGIHLISGSIDEVKDAKELVNSTGGDWGYVTFLIESKNRDTNRWQNFFNELRRAHLIPIVRLATQTEDNSWKRPYDGEEIAWADFLDSLNWPTKNRYIVIYNEPNHATEWGGKVDPKSYAEVLDRTITALKSKNSDFFVLNAGFDTSAPQQAPNYYDEFNFIKEMEQAVPGILERLDGWSSHSYPQPNFAASPGDTGRGSVRTWSWELAVLQALGVNKSLPVFITETGWKHAEGISYDQSLPTSETVGNYLEYAFSNAWSSSQIMSVTPFLLNYQEEPFDHFSFKKITGEKQNIKILGIQYPDYYPQFETVVNLPKAKGEPNQIESAKLTKGELPHALVGGELYHLLLTFENNGQSIWGDGNQIRVISNQLLQTTNLPEGTKVEPNQSHTFNLALKSPEKGSFRVSFNLYQGNNEFDSPPFEFTFQVKDPVKLQSIAKLQLSKKLQGDYTLQINSPSGVRLEAVQVSQNGLSEELEAKYLYPDGAYDFTLSRPFYRPKTIHRTVYSGPNTLDFGTLDLDWPAVLNNLLGFLKTR